VPVIEVLAEPVAPPLASLVVAVSEPAFADELTLVAPPALLLLALALPDVVEPVAVVAENCPPPSVVLEAVELRLAWWVLAPIVPVPVPVAVSLPELEAGSEEQALPRVAQPRHQQSV